MALPLKHCADVRKWYEKSRPTDLVSTTNPAASRADFTYGITPTTLVITDTGQGAKSVVEDLPAVLRRIEHWHLGVGCSPQAEP
jgi:hypothetical protein